ncbi:MAG: SH3 domain-containing protein [Chloroflexi bacterium]|nr:SH3 domain-containing protein [Chloroflexota bacterium]
MKAKLLAIILAVFFLYSFASAQGYDIRTTSRNNLRAAPSLDGTFLETVPAGTVLHVVGRSGRWLKINRNGIEVWMADWLGYSRVEGGEGTAPQPASNVPAQIDNCCFVDRQCHTPADWTVGWHAFQDGQCPAPGQSQPQTSTQPVGNVPAHVDNCCFVDRQCQSAADWENGFYAFRDKQCPAPGQSRPQTSAQSLGNVPAQVDNCCFVDRQCNTPADWENGFYAYLAGQCSVSTGSSAPSTAGISVSTPNMTEGVKRFLANPSTDPFNNCCFMHYDGTCHSDEDWKHGALQYQNHQCIHPAPLWTRPVIVGNDSPLGTAKFTKLVNTALELMRVHTPEWLKYIEISGVREFRLLPADVGGGFFNRHWSVGHGYYSWQQEDPNWEPDLDYIVGYAGGITHEACHAIKQRTYTQTTGWANELPCVEAQLAVIETIKPDSRDVGWLRNMAGQ